MGALIVCPECRSVNCHRNDCSIGQARALTKPSQDKMVKSPTVAKVTQDNAEGTRKRVAAVRGKWNAK